MQFSAKILLASLVLASLPVVAQAQGTVRGAEQGARQGERDAGPVGAVVGGTLGAVAGTVGGILGVEERPRFRTYVVEQRVPSYRYESEFRVGAVLPEQGVTYYEVPADVLEDADECAAWARRSAIIAAAPKTAAPKRTVPRGRKRPR